MHHYLGILMSILFSASALAVGDDSVPPSILRVDVVRARIAQAVQDADENPEQAIEDLRSMLGRTDDPLLKGVAGYDLGVLAHQQGEFDIAAQLYRDADRQSTDPTLRSSARFNLGHALYAKAHGGDEPASIDDLN
ncbi:MAG: hypothetical protein JKY96_00395, partial [Phycisphaerales bacterium]|nr:hypothetical protein [Phycisphaerales bacterium]